MMNDRKTTIERAFELAAAGTYRTVSEIRAVLRQERYEMVDSTLAGKGLREQLKRVMAAGRDAQGDKAASG